MTHFTCTSDLPYNHHKYKVVHTDKTIKKFDYWEKMFEYWYYHPSPEKLDHVIIIDKK